MGKISAETHKVYRGEVSGDGRCLFSSFVLVIKPLLRSIFGNTEFQDDLIDLYIEDLRIRVANYIRSNPDMKKVILAANTEYKTVEEYCSAIEQGELWGGDAELRALSSLYNILICKVDLLNIIPNHCLKPSYYGEDNSKATQCVYIYYNGTNHFDPLYVMNMKNQNDKQTIFDPNDQIVNDLLRKFIKEELKYYGEVELGRHTTAPVTEISKPTNDETTMLNSLFPTTPMEDETNLLSTSSTDKNRVNAIPMSTKTNMRVRSTIPDEDHVSNKRMKVTQDVSDQTSTYNKIDATTMAKNDIIQDNQDETANLSTDLKNEYQKEKIESETKRTNKLDGKRNNNESNCYNSKQSF